MAVIRDWIIDIITIVMISVFAEILMPEGDFKKYTKLVIGVIIMIFIIKPVLRATTEEYMLDSYTAGAMNQLEQQKISRQNNILQQKQTEQVMKAYREKLSSQMKETIESMSRLNIADFDFDINEDSESRDFGAVKAIRMVLNAEGSHESEVKEVVPVIIGKETRNNAVRSKNYELSDEEREIKNRIEVYLQNTYGIPLGNIHIQIQKNQWGDINGMV